MKKILVISDKAFLPVERGNQELIYENIKLFNRLNVEVDFLYVSSSLNEKSKKMIKYLGIDHFFWFNSGNVRKKIGVREWIRIYIKKRGLANRIVIPYTVDELYPEGLSEEVCSLYEKYNYDIIWLEYVYFSKALLYLGDKVVKVIETHDKNAGRGKEFVKNKLAPTGFYTTFLGEKKGLRRADVVVAIQKEEERYFSKMLRAYKKIKVVTYRGNLDCKRSDLPQTKTVCFIGSSYSLNVYALKWFLENVWCIIQERESDAKLYIVGGICEELIESKQYYKLGIVDDLDKIYASMRVIINPIQGGNGMNIKMVEAIAHLKPIVTTTRGARGIYSKEELFKCADKPEDFAEAVIELLLDDWQCENLAYNCAKFIVSYNEENEKNLREIIGLEN